MMSAQIYHTQGEKILVQILYRKDNLNEHRISIFIILEDNGTMEQRENYSRAKTNIHQLVLS